MRKSTILCLFIPYAIILSSVLFCRTPDGLGFGLEALKERLQTSVNLVPFHTLGSYKSAYLAGNMSSTTYYLNIYGNTVLFLPMGMMIPYLFVKKFSFFKSLAAVLLIVTFVEALQLLCGIGRADIDDIILNFLGAVVGRVLVIEKKHKNTCSV